MFRGVLAGMALMVCAADASAQVTTYIAPPRPPSADPLVVAAADSARRDSIATVAMTNMKAWVDSAAGVTVPAHVGDSTVNDPGRPVTTGSGPVSPNATPVTTTFSEGSVAPATASDLPALAILGVVGLLAGAALIAYRPRG
jgi:hypothetical protein